MGMFFPSLFVPLPPFLLKLWSIHKKRKKLKLMARCDLEEPSVAVPVLEQKQLNEISRVLIHKKKTERKKGTKNK